MFNTLGDCYEFMINNLNLNLQCIYLYVNMQYFV